MTAKTEIEKLAEQVAKAANEVGVSLESRIDALKALTPYYGTILKNKARLDDDGPPNGPSFGDFRAGLEEADGDHANGRSPTPPIRAGRRAGAN